MRRVPKIPLLLSMLCLVVVAAWSTTANPRVTFNESEEKRWLPTTGYDPCFPQETGRVCAEWRTYGQPTGVRCCIDPMFMGTQNASACAVFLDGTPGLVGGRVPSDDHIE